MEEKCYAEQFGCNYSGNDLRQVTVNDFTCNLCPNCEQKVVWGFINEAGDPS